jgi:hypothetical protein
MMVQPPAAYLGATPDTLKILPGPRGELYIECEVVAPRSARGRTVDLRVPVGQIPALLKAARSAAISVRNQPEKETSDA